jgi:dihydropteroate synthase
MQKLSVEDTYFKPNSINVNGNLIDLSSPKVMGILNVTDDSFYKDSRLHTDKDVLTRAERMLEEGATFLDIGGYSTRPNAIPISIELEKKRVESSIKSIIHEFPNALISIDTFRSNIAQVAIDSGALIINDISGFNFDPEIIEIASRNKVPYVLMHIKGSLKTMHEIYQYDSIINEVKMYFQEKIEVLLSNNILDIIIDPGFGFSKSLEQNYELFDQIERLQSFQKPILIGISRKSMIYKRLNCTPEESLKGTIALNKIALLKGASILRVHDVKEAKNLIDLHQY